MVAREHWQLAGKQRAAVEDEGVAEADCVRAKTVLVRSG